MIGGELEKGVLGFASQMGLRSQEIVELIPSQIACGLAQKLCKLFGGKLMKTICKSKYGRGNALFAHYTRVECHLAKC